MRAMTRAVVTAMIVVTVGAAAGCGFDCDVDGERVHFNDCDALQAELDGRDPLTEAAARDDLLVCGEISGCEVEQ